jgi:hypothetical protein
MGGKVAMSGNTDGPVFQVETVQALGTNGGTTSAINTTNVNFLAACVTHLDSVTTTLSDSQSNTWTLVRKDDPGSQAENDLYYVYAPTTNSAQTFTLTGTGSKSGIAVLGFSNMASSPLDQQNGANSSSNQTSFGPGSITPTTSNEVIIPCLTTFLSQANGIAGFSGFQAYPYSGTSYSMGSAYKIQFVAAAISPLFTIAATASTSAAGEASFISNGSPIPNCTSCTYYAASTNSGGSGEVSDPTSLTASVPTGTLFIAFGWHTNFTGSGTTTTTGSGLTWRSCLDGSTNTFADLKVTSTVGMSCNYAFTTVAGAAGATIAATDCASNCTNLGGIYVAYSGVFIPRAWDAFCSNTFATSGTGANNMTSGSCAPSQANDLTVIYCNSGSGAAQTSAGTTPIAFASLASRQNLNGGSTDAIYASSSPVTPTMTGPNTSGYACMTVMLK